MRRGFLNNFKKNVKNITRYRNKLAQKAKKNKVIGSINEWVVDNYYVVNEEETYTVSNYLDAHIRRISKNNKKEIYFLIYQILKEKDFNLNMNYLFKKINIYEEEKKRYFSYKEIDYIYLIIRIIIIEELNNLTLRLNARLDIKDSIEDLFEKISTHKNSKNFNLDNYIKIDEEILNNAYYIEHLTYRLKILGEKSENFFVKLNELLIRKNSSIKDTIKESNNDIAKDNFLIMNLFNALKEISKYKIEYLYKNISFTEKALINETDNTYDMMYDSNKVEYRNKIIKKAKKLKMGEYEYAKKLVEKANSENKHVGWYLFKDKNVDLRAKLYVLILSIFTITISYILSIYLGIGMFFLSLIPSSVLVMEIMNQIIMRKTSSRSLFKLKFEEGIPEEYSTIVVIPTILNNVDVVRDMFENLEIYYLSNKTDNLYFCLSGDPTSEVTKDVDRDNDIVNVGLKKVAELNEKYGKELFYFAYRNRFYSEGEECYLGYERKRGMLIQLNKLLLNKLSNEDKNKYFKTHTFDNFNVPIKYMITLDRDTKLVLNTAQKLVGTMAHPMNRPVLDKDGQKVISGYGVMQPRISVDATATNKSKYSQLFAGLGGLDIYVTATFDIYQDLYGEANFVGKGIYDIPLFDKLISDAFPDNLVLSHDCIEGFYTRCGFINDSELFEGFPTNYLKDASLHHRWNRGDWQIIGWLKKKVKNAHNQKYNNPINFLSKWKIVDDLRRSLVSIFLVLVLIYGFTIGKASPYYYTIFDLIIIAIPILFYILSKIMHRSKHDLFLKYYQNLIRGFIAFVNKSFVTLIILPREAYLYIDSIVRALYRMLISHKKLLNWIASHDVKKREDLNSYIKFFTINYIVAFGIIGLTLIFKSEYFILTSSIAFLWVLGPIIMYFMGKRLKTDEKELKKDEKDEIKEIAYKTWGFFKDLLKEETNYLIPDNYQYNRRQRIDSRTSTSNIGYSLVSIVSAGELEFINHKTALNLINNIIDTIERLEKWNGHLFNWYDIYSLNKLPNYFVSTVDNGNFLASLYVVKGYLEIINEKSLIQRIEKIIEEMDFSKLYNSDEDVFSVGYNYSEQSLLTYHYNNFASEARLASFIAIAKGDVPYKHWFCLDKTLTRYKRYKGVVSWSGTAFEYFMPLIFMNTFKHTLLDETYYFAYHANKEFMKEVNRSLPWGMSESAYNELDDSENYKYNAFGVPYLKFQDSPSTPIVISPYSSMMAIEIDDKEVYHNIEKFKKLGMIGEYGFYEAYDYDDEAIIKIYYAHHQGMILASLTNYLKNDAIRKYFHSDKTIEAYEMLLKEKVQIEIYIDKKQEKYKKYNYKKEQLDNDVREFNDIKDISEYGVLSNGFYSILINDRGIGFSKYKNLQINRYRKAPSEDYGMFMYIRNLNNGNVWTNTYAPLNKGDHKYKTIFASDRIKFVREDDGIATTTEITVVKDHNAEIRKVTFMNYTNEDVLLEITSYGEIIMCRNEEDIAHRTFNSIKIESELDEKTSSLIFTRKSATKENTKYYIINRLFIDNDKDSFLEYETNRTHFMGRNNNLSNPKVIIEKEKLSNKVGASIDPIMSIRKRILIPAKDKNSIYLLVGFGKSKEQVIEIVETYNDKFSIDKAFNLTTVYNNMMNSYTNINGNDKRLYNEILRYLYTYLPHNNERKELLNDNNLSISNLWGLGISGDLPIITVEINDIEDAGFIEEVLKIYEFLKSKTLYIDIVILIEEDKEKEKYISNYINKLMYRINNLNYFENTLGNAYVLNNLNNIDKNLIKIVSSIYLNASLDISIDKQIRSLRDKITISDKVISNKNYNMLDVSLPQNIDLYNNYGGFINDGKEYFITTPNTPTPWVNIIPGENFGTIISNNLGGFTYAYNSREFKLTSWSNDITSDLKSERLIINNTEFTPSYIRHGFGYSIFVEETKEYSIFMKVFVSKNNTIKFYDIKVTNKLNINQNIKFDLILKMVLGVDEEATGRFLTCTFNRDENVLYIENKFQDKFKDIKAFISSTEIISDYIDEDVVHKGITINIALNPNESKTFSFLLGTGTDTLDKYKNAFLIDEEFKKINESWSNLLNTITVNTPDKSFNYMINGWLLYQVYASRLIARAGFYQVGGAIGYRDQLQDCMAAIYSNPSLTRKQILVHANHQFKEGDVPHWWHEEYMLGSRTKFSDDYLWLVYVTSEYVKITEDYSILDEKAKFIDGDKLSKTEGEKGVIYHYLEEEATLYEHLKLCIKKALSQIGKHGIPLMGSGDWNDGMNKVGIKGKGESVFVGFFLYDLLNRMSKISEKYNDTEFSNTCIDSSNTLKEKLNKNAWDGKWYLRAFFDNGDPLGSRNNTECRIDLLSQSWSIISGVCEEDKKESIYGEVEKQLVDKDNKIIKLLTPPFKESKNNPGYIMDYIKGTRENGGQYTHAALWYVMALLKDNKIDKAYEYYQMINPINHSLNEEEVNKYKTEPYVLTADIYSNKDQLGRGGWSWYTGSAGWAYKIAIEEIIGLKKEGNILKIVPKISSNWDSYEITYNYLDTKYIIIVDNKYHLNTSKTSLELDGVKLDNNYIELINDKKEHRLLVIMEEE